MAAQLRACGRWTRMITAPAAAVRHRSPTTKSGTAILPAAISADWIRQ
jgi:hypothetical protein